MITTNAEFLTAAQLAARHAKSPRTLANERSAGMSPVPYVKIGGRVLYRLADVLAYEKASVIGAGKARRAAKVAA